MIQMSTGDDAMTFAEAHAALNVPAHKANNN